MNMLSQTCVSHYPSRWWMSVMLVLTLALPLILVSQSAFANERLVVDHPGAELWREVRQRGNEEPVPANTQIQKVNAGVLINVKGEEWQETRQTWIIQYGGYFMLAVIAFLAVLWLVVKKSPIPDGRSGKTLLRMSSMQRVAHWLFAGVIGFMALTGVLLLFGRTVIIPLIGAEGFSPIASASKEGHNLIGPLLIVAVLLMLVHFIRYNFPARGDLKWLVTLGGLLSKGHPRVGFFNPGEKLLYWATVVLGIVLSLTGLLLLFPYFPQTANNAPLALIIHGIAALLIIALAFAHIWMVRTVDGTLDAMMGGEVDENWAKVHHALWYEKQKQHVRQPSADTGEAGAGISTSAANQT